MQRGAARQLPPPPLQLAEQRLIAGRDTAEVLLKHFEYKVRTKLAAATAAAAAAAVGEPPPLYFDEQREMSLAEMEARREAAEAALDAVAAPRSAAASGPDGAHEEVEPDVADLLDVVLDAVVQEGNDDDLDVAFDVTAAGPDAVDADSDDE